MERGGGRGVEVGWGHLPGLPLERSECGGSAAVDDIIVARGFGC